MKSLRSKLIKSHPNSLEYEEYSKSREESDSMNFTYLKSAYKLKNHSDDDAGLSDLERENQKNLLEAKKLIQQTKTIIQRTGKSLDSNKSFEGSVSKTSGSLGRCYKHDKRKDTVNQSNFTINEENKHPLNNSYIFSLSNYYLL